MGIGNRKRQDDENKVIFYCFLESYFKQRVSDSMNNYSIFNMYYTPAVYI